jgi:hypothetical protein
VIKENLLEEMQSVFQFFFRHHEQHCNYLNTATCVLIPKKVDAKRIGIIGRLAWRKHLKVCDEFENLNWTRGLWRMMTATEMVEFVSLWDKVQHIQLIERPTK